MNVSAAESEKNQPPRVSYYSMKEKLKEKLKENLSFSVRQRVKKYGVRFLRSLVQTSGKALNVAAKNGFDLEREISTSNFPAAFTNGQTQNAPPPFGVVDFLLLTEKNAPADSARKVETSIIIPVFNKAEYTFQCLRSLFRQIDLTRNEIVVVDNASSDETHQVLELLKNRVRVVRNEQNNGFVDACNQGAAAARGEYLVFLNNDTIVQTRWLESLVETAAADERIGAVGSKLIFPNGQMQEAGAIIWRDGYSHAYGYGGDAENAEFNFARESIIVRARRFNQKRFV